MSEVGREIGLLERNFQQAKQAINRLTQLQSLSAAKSLPGSRRSFTPCVD